MTADVVLTPHLALHHVITQGHAVVSDRHTDVHCIAVLLPEDLRVIDVTDRHHTEVVLQSAVVLRFIVAQDRLIGTAGGRDARRDLHRPKREATREGNLLRLRTDISWRTKTGTLHTRHRHRSEELAARRSADRVRLWSVTTTTEFIATQALPLATDDVTTSNTEDGKLMPKHIFYFSFCLFLHLFVEVDILC